VSIVALPPRDSPVPAYAWPDWRDPDGCDRVGQAVPSPRYSASPLSRAKVSSWQTNGRPVAAPRTAAYGFPLQSTTPRRARRHTVEFARRWGLDAVSDPAELLVSELMTNAFEASQSCLDRRHDPARAAAPLQLRLAVVLGRLRIEVRDHNPRPPMPDDPDTYEEHGRGLLLVESYSEGWGYHRLPNGGKAVWCVVAPD
jgi:hypothetical protein